MSKHIGMNRRRFLCKYSNIEIICILNMVLEQQLTTPDREVETKVKYVGSNLKSLDGRAILKGEMLFGEDLEIPDLLYIGFVRSEYAHAGIIGVNLSKALEINGVLAALTAEDLEGKVKPGSHMFPYPKEGSREWIPGVKALWKLPLASKKVHFVGEAIAVVVCSNKYVVEDAVESVEVSYKPLPAIINVEEALKSESPLIYEEHEDNIAMQTSFPKEEDKDIELAFQEADKVVEGVYSHHRISPSPMETRNVTASYDKNSGLLTIWEGTQNPSWIRTQVANSLGMSEESVRIISPRSGGAFGVKSGGAYDETFVVAYVAKTMRCSVRWVESRTEHFTSSGHAREQLHKYRVAVNKKGRILALDDRIMVDGGAINTIWSSWQSTLFSITGPYRIDKVKVNLTGVFTNKAPYWAYRGYGKYDAAVAMERIMDRISAELNIDPIEVRKTNLIRKEDFPYETPTGALMDSGNYLDGIRNALDSIDYESTMKEIQGMRNQGRLVGFGLVVCMEPTGIGGLFGRPGYETVRLKISPTLDIVVETATTDQGQSHSTAIAQVVADELGVTPGSVTTREGDTMNLPYGVGTISSRFSTYTVSAVVKACEKAREKLFQIASFKLGVDASDLIIEDEQIVSNHDNGKRISLRSIAQIAYLGADELPGFIDPGLEFLVSYRFPTIGKPGSRPGARNIFATYPFIVHTAVVEVDPETGEINILRYVALHDCGTVINRKEIEVHSIGSLVQGIGSALTEQIVYDENGQPLTSSFWDYIVPTSNNVPEFELVEMITPSPFTPLGTKGGSETNILGPPPVIAQAVEDALRKFNVRIEDFPMSMERIWHKLN